MSGLKLPKTTAAMIHTIYVITGPEWEVGQSVHRKLTLLPAATGPAVNFAGEDPDIPPAVYPPH
jgi:hypothetical protein